MAEEQKKTVKKAPAKKTATKKATTKKAEAEKVEAVENEVVETKKPAKKTAKKAAKKAEVKVEPVKPAVTEATAFARDVRITPRKVRLVADLVRGKDVKVALGILAVTNKVAVAPVAKIINSAAANAVNNFHLDGSKLYIAEIQVGDGLKIKRYIPRAKGSASGIVKRNANIRITLKERN